MLRLMTMFAGILVPAAAHAADPAVHIGERDGVRFEYTTELTKKGQVQLTGRLLPSGDRFSLIVDAKGRVHGDFAGSYVEYDVPAAKHDSILASLTPAPSGAAATASAVQAIAPR